MGRPINSRYIGNTSTSGQQITATAYFGDDSQPRTAYISAQKGTNIYDMVSVDGLHSGMVQLTEGNIALAPGQANITVTNYDNIVEFAEKITNRMVYTWEGNEYEWIFSNEAITTSNQAQIQSS
jgi:hypothetical protein